MFTKINIGRSQKAASGAPQGKSPHILVWDWEEVLSMPPRDGNGIKLEGGINFRPGKYAVKIYATSSSISLPRTSEGEEDQVGFNSLPEFSHPGSSLEIEEFIANMTNRPLGVAVQTGDCDGGESYYKVYGTPCNPLSLLVEGQDNNEALKDMMKFQQFRKSIVLPARYYGTFTFDEANLVPADVTAVDVVNGSGEYQLQDNALATEIVDLSNAVHQGTYTLIGSGGTNPATITAASANFILAGSTDWQGLAGSRITLKAYAQGAGEFVFIETSRSA